MPGLLAMWCYFYRLGVVWWLYEPAGIWMMLIPICTVVIYCFETDRWCLMLTFDRDGVLYKPLFRKGMRIQYSNYPRIQYAYYMHGNMFAAYKVNFLFSRTGGSPMRS